MAKEHKISKSIKIKKDNKEEFVTEKFNKPLKSIKDIFNDGHSYINNYILMHGEYLQVVSENTMTVVAERNKYDASIERGKNGISFYAFGRDELCKSDEFHNDKTVFIYLK